jgi:hypothetical protein
VGAGVSRPPPREPILQANRYGAPDPPNAGELRYVGTFQEGLGSLLFTCWRREMLPLVWLLLGVGVGVIFCAAIEGETLAERIAWGIL